MAKSHSSKNSMAGRSYTQEIVTMTESRSFCCAAHSRVFGKCSILYFDAHAYRGGAHMRI